MVPASVAGPLEGHGQDLLDQLLVSDSQHWRQRSCREFLPLLDAQTKTLQGLDHEDLGLAVQPSVRLAVWMHAVRSYDVAPLRFDLPIGEDGAGHRAAHAWAVWGAAVVGGVGAVRAGRQVGSALRPSRG